MKILLFLMSAVFAFGSIMDTRESGLYTNDNTAYLTDIKSIPLNELRYIYSGKLKVLNNSLPVIVLLKPLDNKEQEVILKHLLNISPDQLKEEVKSRANFIIINNTYSLLIKLESTLGAISIIEDSLYYSKGDGTLVKIKVIE